jgi:hypothetical protein
VERLLIFFAGHGVSRGTNIDYWILTDGVRNTNESVNVDKSVRLARSCGIAHVIFIADACRTPATAQQLGVDGYAIFPAENIEKDVQIDQFFATRSGDPSYETVSADDLRKAYGVFTECLLPALRGRKAEALASTPDSRGRQAVVAERLGPYLVGVVPREAAKLGLRQRPDCIAGSYYPPNAVAFIEPSTAATSGRSGSVSIGAPPSSRPRRRRPARPSGGRASPPPLVIPPTEDHELLADAARIEEVEQLRSRSHFETRAGLSILGATPARVAVTGRIGDLFEESFAWHVRGGGEPQAAIVDLGDDRYVATAIIPGFIGGIHVGPSGVDVVSYQAGDGSPYEDERYNAGTPGALAWLGAAAKYGFRDWAIDEANQRADYFRNFKHVNPTFGIYAAYAYERAGNRDEIRSMIRAFEAAQQTIPYDLIFLTGTKPESLTVPVVPRYPLLTQGWAYLDEAAVHPAIAAARSSLAPTVWACPTGRAGQELFDAVFDGVVEVTG